METVEYTCRHCGKVMAVLVSSLGGEVECPHCLQVMTADAPAEEPAPPAEAIAAAFAEAPTEPEPSVPSLTEQESDFSPPVEIPSETSPPNLQIDSTPPPPEEPALAAAPEPPPPTETTIPDSEPEPAAAADSPYTDEPTVAATPAPPDGPILATALPAEAEPAAHPAPEAKTEAETHDDETVLPTPHRRVVVKAGATVPLLLIFLIPYSAVATIAIGWLIYQQRTQPAPFDPLERLPDTRPDKGGARRVKFDEPLPEKLKTSLQQPLTVGDVEVTPLLVERTPLGELVLKVKLRNVSSDVAFDPLPAVFLAYDHSKKTSLKPYSFVEIGRNHLYGTSLEWKETPARPKASPFDGVLNHGEELTAVLRTPDNKEYVALVNNLDRNKGEILWRLHVRRGFVQVKGKDVSATAVVGVRINAAAIPRQAPANALLTPQARSRLPYFTIGGFQISGIF